MASGEAATEERPHGGTMRCWPSGKFVDPTNLRREDIDLGDIVLHLSHQTRYAGAVPFLYTVLEHQLYVEQVLRDRGADLITRLAGLWHDAPEAYLIDLPRPLKGRPEFAFYRALHDRAWGVIWPVVRPPMRFETSETGYDADHVHLADNLVGAEERDWLWRGTMPGGFLVLPRDHRVSGEYLRCEFLARHQKLVAGIRSDPKYKEYLI